jgi:HK97 family phage major capsid protein
MPDQSVRERNLTRMQELLAAAGDDGLSPEQATEFDQAEARVRSADDIAMRSTAIADAMGRLGNVIPDSDTNPVVHRQERSVDNLPRIAFGDEQLREAHSGLLENRPVTIVAEQRAIVAPPMSTVADYKLDPVPFAREPVRVASYIPTQLTSAASVVYMRGSTAASAAATVAEGAAKPESSPGWTAVTVPIRKIAHWCQVSREALQDFGTFEQVLANEMTQGVVLQENAQIIGGDGLGTNLVGLTAVSGIQTYAPVAAEARILSILHGITLLRTGSSFVEADRIILHPNDWEIVLKYAATTGELIVSPTPQSAQGMSLWGVPVTVTSQLSAGTAIVANLAESSVIFSREPVQIYVDVFGLMTSNMIRLVAEERLALGVTRPSAVVRISFNGTT